MPQMLYYLNVDKETTVISGTTCADGLLKNEANEVSCCHLSNLIPTYF
jgi:hypothetical protein